MSDDRIQGAGGFSSSPPPRPLPTDEDVAEQMAQQPYEPLLPIEKKLIAGSLVLGVVLLGLLLWISYTYFPVR